MVASNFTLNDVSLCPKYRKPFDIIAKGLSRPNWLPFVNSFRTFIVTPPIDILEVFSPSFVNIIQRLT